MNSMSKEIRGIAGQLGLSLDSRLRIVGLDGDDDEEDLLGAMMNDDD